MATAEIASQPTDRHAKRRPFANLMKRLTNLKSSDTPNTKKGANGNTSKSKKQTNAVKNNPYPQSAHAQRHSDTDSANEHLSSANPSLQRNNGSLSSFPVSGGKEGTLADSNKSAAPTVATNAETVHSDAGNSKALTATTGAGASSTIDGAGPNSTFSSPNHSVRSLATTLTTIQSTSAGNNLNQATHTSSLTHATNGLSPYATQFSHQYPISPNPASALPAHLAPTGNPTTYSGATANNLLTDDASILTLASSSKRRRRRSMDTDASVRALAPSSVWGGSRESLPLSMLSGHMDHGSNIIQAQSQSRPSISGIASAERASVYSSHGASAPALTSERNSFYATSHRQTNKDKDSRSIDGRSVQNRDGGDAKSVNFDNKSLHRTESLKYEGSVRSGSLGHGRNDSIPGNLSRNLTSGSRLSSEWARDQDYDEEEH